MKLTKVQASLILFHLKDLQDWDSLQQGKLRIISKKFDLHSALMEVFDMMEVQSQLRGIYLKFDQ
jgi:hypothetical protein